MNLTFPNVHGNSEIYMDCLRAICGDHCADESFIDLCCNLAPHTPLLGFAERCYIDVLPRILDHPEEQQFFIQKDVLAINPFLTYDTSICSDGIEHFKKEDGYKLLGLMYEISYKQILFTPLGEYMVDPISKDPEGHHSGWTPEDVPGHATIVFPQYHPTLNVGAFFFWSSDNLQEDFERVEQILKTKSWAK